jgi:hypothetical protein
MLVGDVLVPIKIVKNVLLAALQANEIDVAQNLRLDDLHAFGVQQDVTVLDLQQRDELNELSQLFVVGVGLQHGFWKN